MSPGKRLTHQLVVRMEEELYRALERDAQEHGRTIAQSVRFKLRELAREGEGHDA